MMARNAKRKRSIMQRILLSLLIIAVLTTSFLVVSLSVGGAFTELTNNALDMLDERTQNKRQPLQDSMISQWSNLEATAETVRNVINRHLVAADADIQAMKTDAALNAEIVMDIAPTLVSRLRAGRTTGIFVILNGIGIADQPDTWAGIYLRDADPSANNSTNSDLLMLRGLPPVSRELGVSLDSYWQAAFTFENNGDFFFKPMEAVQKGTSDCP